MKKLISILMITILVFGLSGCEVKQKAETAYIEAFDKVFDIRTIAKAISPGVLMTDQTLDGIIDYLSKERSDYVVIRAECTGNWVQKEYASYEHSRYHRTVGTTYIEIPLKIIKVLEGNEKIVEGLENLQLEVARLNMTEPIPDSPYGDKYILTYYGGTNHFVYPRIGCEYILVLEYHKETDCIALYEGGGIICELSKPKDYYKYWCTIHNKPIREEIDYDYGIPPMYYEALERYNIKVK
jgi:hypothetical protein